MSVARKALGPIAGIVVAGAVIALTESILHRLPMQDALFAGVAAGYGLGALAGGAAAARIARHRIGPILVALVLAALAAINLFAMPHPWWFAPLAALLLFAACRVAMRWVPDATISRA